jgi:PIN domain-containing protein
MARKPPKPKKWLVFIDTNILLDFYRLPGESAIRQLKALEKHRQALILGDQLSMEFLKNRQVAIVAGIQAMQKPLRPTVPSVLLDAQAAKTLMKNYATTDEKWQQSKKRIERMLTNPSTADPVYQHLMRIFDHEGDFNLKRTNKVRFTIRNLARKRFALGYPPRKQNATSLGDSINWEWIVHCAITSKDNHNVLIVSRDSDFGVTYAGKATLNDWLYREFKERVSRKRNVELTQKLTDALKCLNEQVTAGDLAEEERLIKTVQLTAPDFTLSNVDISPHQERS